MLLVKYLSRPQLNYQLSNISTYSVFSFFKVGRALKQI